MSWLCIDSETTGIDPVQDRIVELAAVHFHNGEVRRRMGMLVNPGIPIPEGASAIHGIFDHDVATSPALRDIAERFLAHVRTAEVLVGYNWPFDASFLQQELGDSWREAIANKPVIDALVVVRLDRVGRYWKGTGRHKLDAVAAQLQVVREGKSHRASSDCVVTCRILWKLRDQLPEDLHEVTELLASERERQERDYEAWRKSKGPGPSASM